MNSILKKVAKQQAWQVAEMSIDMAEEEESLQEAWLNFFAFIANHDVDLATMNHLRGQLVAAEIQLDPHAAIETANKRLVLEAKWRKNNEEARLKREAGK